jgi:hypothetical protein
VDVCSHPQIESYSDLIGDIVIRSRREEITMSERAFFTVSDNDRCVDCLSIDIIHVPPTAPFCLECGNYINRNWLGVI